MYGFFFIGCTLWHAELPQTGFEPIFLQWNFGVLITEPPLKPLDSNILAINILKKKHTFFAIRHMREEFEG